MDLLIGERIKKYRKNKEMTQDALAQALTVSPQSISKWECGDGKTLHNTHFVNLMQILVKIECALPLHSFHIYNANIEKHLNTHLVVHQTSFRYLS